MASPANPARPITLDPALGNPMAARLRGELGRGEWRRAHATLETLRDWDERAFMVGALADFEGRPAWLEDWARQRPRSPLPLLVRGAHSIQWAWEARTSATADKVSAAQAQVFLGRLEEAERDLEQVAAQDAADPTPHALLISSGMGRGLQDAELARRFAEAVRRHPAHRGAHARRLVSLTAKWGGSHEAMFEFARAAGRSAADGSSLHTLVVSAHVERWVAFAMAGDAAGYGRYLRTPEVVAEILEAHARLRGGAPSGPSADAFDRNILAFALWKCGEREKAGEEIAALGPLLVRLPWGFAGDAVKVFLRARAECLGISDPAAEQRMTSSAETATTMARDDGMELDYSWESLRTVDRMVAGYQVALGQIKDEKRARDGRTGVVLALGAYVGEVARRRFGGAWIDDPQAAEGSALPVLVSRGTLCHALKLVAAVLAQVPPRSVAELMDQWGSAAPAPVTPPPATGAATAAEKMRAEAAAFVKGAAAAGVTGLAFDEASLAQLDRLVVRLREGLAPLKDEERRLAAAPLGVRLGAYLGEVLCKAGGGAWTDALPDLPPGLAAVDMGGQVALTIAAAFGLLLDGATALGERTARSTTEYVAEVLRLQRAWLEGRVLGSAAWSPRWRPSPRTVRWPRRSSRSRAAPC